MNKSPLYALASQEINLLANSKYYGLYEYVVHLEKVGVSHQQLLESRSEDKFLNQTNLAAHLLEKNAEKIVLVWCAACGTKLGEVSQVPGKQVIGCYNCGEKTIVEINIVGGVKTSKR